MTWTELLAPAGGRTYLHADLGGLFAWSGSKGLCFCDGVLWRIDRAVGTAERMDVTIGDVVYAIAVSADGRYAFSIEQGVGLQGHGLVGLPGVAKLCFGAGGGLWAADHRRLHRIDGRTGEVVWSVDASGSFLAVSGETAVLAGWGAMTVVTGRGEAHALTPSLGVEVSALKCCDERAYVAGGSGDERAIAVWELLARTETLHALPTGVALREFAVTQDGCVAFRSPGGITELDLREGTTREMEFPAGPTVGLDALDDDRQYVGVLEWESSIARVDRATGRAIGVTAPVPATLWSLAVAPDGRVASAHDGEWRVTAPDGALLHREAVDGQVCDVAFSVDGSRLAVLRPCPAGCHLDLVDASRFIVVSTRVVAAGGVRFLPDGARLALLDGATVTLCDAATLAAQCLLAHSDKHATLHGVVFADGRITAHDDRGRVVCFDDPGALAAAKKPPKVKPTVMVPSTGARPTTYRSSNDHLSAVFPFDGRLAVFDGKIDGLAFIDPATKKSVERVRDTRGYFLLDAPRYLRAEESGCSVRALGSTEVLATFPRMPTMAACSRDGHFVVVALHGGLWLARV